LRIDYCPQCNFRLDVRSSEQNSKLHALLQDIAEQKQWAGQRWDVEDWKRLITAAWLRARGDAATVIPAIDGKGFDVLYRKTSRMSKQEMSELLEYAAAWAIDQGVEIERIPERQ